MPEGENNNQTNQHRRQRNQPDTDGEHETHTTALVLLVLAVVVIVVVILSVARTAEDGNLSPGNFGNQISQPADESHGAGIPVESVSTTQEEGLNGFPSALTLPDGADIVQNYSSQLGDEHTQRIAVFDTQESTANLIGLYTKWMNQNGYEVENTRNEGQGGSIIASNGGDNLTIAITDVENGNRVQLNYVTGS